MADSTTDGRLGGAMRLRVADVGVAHGGHREGGGRSARAADRVRAILDRVTYEHPSFIWAAPVFGALAFIVLLIAVEIGRAPAWYTWVNVGLFTIVVTALSLLSDVQLRTARARAERFERRAAREAAEHQRAERYYHAAIRWFEKYEPEVASAFERHWAEEHTGPAVVTLDGEA